MRGRVPPRRQRQGARRGRRRRRRRRVRGRRRGHRQRRRDVRRQRQRRGSRRARRGTPPRLTTAPPRAPRWRWRACPPTRPSPSAPPRADSARALAACPARTWRRRASRRLSRWGRRGRPLRGHLPREVLERRAGARGDTGRDGVGVGRRGHLRGERRGVARHRRRLRLDGVVVPVDGGVPARGGGGAQRRSTSRRSSSSPTRCATSRGRTGTSASPARRGASRFSFKAPPWAKPRGRSRAWRTGAAARRTPPRAAASRSSRSSMTSRTRRSCASARVDSTFPSELAIYTKDHESIAASAVTVADDETISFEFTPWREDVDARYEVRLAYKHGGDRRGEGTRRRQPSTISPSLSATGRCRRPRAARRATPGSRLAGSPPGRL